MKKDNIVLNLLVFAEKIENGALQADLLQEASDLGFEKVEIRREYFKNLSQEKHVIQQRANDLGIELFYSVPDEVFVEGKVNDCLQSYLEEAKEMGVRHIKWNIGDFQESSSLDDLEELTNHGIQINVENDQTQGSGTIQPIYQFMEKVSEKQLSIGYVYDLGNWRFVGENEQDAVEKLGDYVRYIHVKDVCYQDGKPQAVALDKGEIEWRKILSQLPMDIPVAIEYPTTSNKEICQAKQKLEEWS
uniref:sugar phosphate isomerase/epimerase family protein n=1 Tax=Candidatus Enterococcus willemsii TaxID=1857215 RepID=UPI00403F477C